MLAKQSNTIARRPTEIPAIYWRLRSPLATMMALVGPVRHVLTLPTMALAAAPTAQAIVTVSIGGV